MLFKLLVVATLLSCSLLYSIPNVNDCVYELVNNSDNFASQFAAKHNLLHYHTGSCTPGKSIYQLSFALKGTQQLHLNEVQTIADECISEFVNYLKKQPITQTYFNNYFTRNPEILKEFNVEYIGIRIGFWSEKMNRIMPPYIAEMRFFDKIYHYYQADPISQELVEIFQEPYEETSSL